MPDLQDIPDTAAPQSAQEYFAGLLPGPKAGVPPPKHSSLAAQMGQPLNLLGATDEIAALSGENGSEPRDEIAELRREVKEKDHAILRAMLSLQDMQQRLDEEKAESLQLRTDAAARRAADENPDVSQDGSAVALSPETRAEVEKQRREWSKIQKSLEREHNLRKAELVKIRGQWHQAQQLLEQESRARRLENAQASGKIARLEQDLSSTNGALTRSYESGSGSGAKRGKRFAAVGVCIAGTLAGGFLWKGHVAQAGSPLPVPAATSQTASHSEPPASVFAASSQSGFQSALRGLNRALSSFGSRPPEEILAEARKHAGDPSICAFRWNNGQPAMLYGTGGMKEHLGDALGRCAVAVQRLH